MTVLQMPRPTKGPSARSPFPGLSDHEIRDLARGAARLATVSCSDPLGDLNAVFRASYRAAHQKVQQQSGPVVVVRGETLTLVTQDKRTTVDIAPPLAALLKSVAQAPLAVVLSLQACGNSLDVDNESPIESLRTSLMMAMTQLGGYGFTSAQSARQAELLKVCLELLDEALATGMPDAERIAMFCRRTRPLVDRNTTEAARLKIDALHARMMTWRSELTSLEWQQLRVVIAGGSTSRRDCPATQYFSKLLSENGAGSRVIPAESAQDEAQALSREATYRLDRQIATTFFEDPEHMDRDLMSNAAREYLQGFVTE